MYCCEHSVLTEKGNNIKINTDLKLCIHATKSARHFFSEEIIIGDDFLELDYKICENFNGNGSRHLLTHFLIFIQSSLNHGGSTNETI